LSGVWSATLPNGDRKDIYVPSSYTLRGKTVFEKTIAVPKDLETHIFELVCEGVSSPCNILVNGQFVLLHIGSGTAFKVDIPSEYLRFGAENVLRLELDSRLDARSTVPLKPQFYDAEPFSGITRNIYLVAKPPVRIEDIDLRYAFTGTNESDMELRATLKCKTSNLKNILFAADSLGNKSLSLSLTVVRDTLVYTAAAPYKFQPESDKFITADLTLKIPSVQKWSTAKPARYQVHAELRNAKGERIDDLHVQTGFRKTELKSGKFFLNGEAMSLKGVHVVEETFLTRSAIGQDEILRDLSLIRTLGANTIYFSQVPSPLWFSLADSLGLLLFINLPIRNTPAPLLASGKLVENIETVLRETMSSAKHSPSVMAFGLGTGHDAAQNTIEVYLEKLSKVVHAESQRFVFLVPKKRLPQAWSAYIDFLGISLEAESTGEAEALLLQARADANGKPVMVTSYRAAPQPNNHNGYSDARSLEYQAKYILDRYKLFEKLSEKDPFIMGSTLSSLADYHLAYAPIQTVGNPDEYLMTSGLVSLEREKKLSFEMLKSLFAGERVYNPPIGSAEEEFSPTLILISIILTVLIVYLINSNKRIRENFSRALIRPFNLFVDVRDSRIYLPSDVMLLTVMWALVWGAVLSALLYTQRDIAVFDFWVTHLVRNKDLKQFCNFLIVHPAAAVPVFAVLFFGLSLLVTMLIKFFLFLVRNTRVRYVQILNVWAWSNVHWVVLVIAPAFIERLDNERVAVAVVILSLVMLLVTFFRFLKGIATIADVNRLPIYALGMVIVLGTLIGIVALTNQYNETLAYFRYWQPAP
jgi:beta-galactosidase